MDKPTNLDELLTPEKTIEEAFQHYDTQMKDENQLHIFNNITSKGIDDFYTAFSKKLDEKFSGNDNASLYGEEDKVKEAKLAGLKAFFKRVSPKTLKAIEEAGDWKEQYKIAAHHFDSEMMGVNPRAGEKGLDAIVTEFTDDKEKTVGHLKQRMYLSKGQQAVKIQGHITMANAHRYLNQFSKTDIMSYVKGLVGKSEQELNSLSKFYTAPIHHLIGVRNKIEGKSLDYLGDEAEKIHKYLQTPEKKI